MPLWPRLAAFGSFWHLVSGDGPAISSPASQLHGFVKFLLVHGLGHIFGLRRSKMRQVQRRPTHPCPSRGPVLYLSQVLNTVTEVTFLSLDSLNNE